MPALFNQHVKSSRLYTVPMKLQGKEEESQNMKRQKSCQFSVLKGHIKDQAKNGHEEHFRVKLNSTR